MGSMTWGNVCWLIVGYGLHGSELHSLQIV